jgi:anaerobic ribonucleoside-triphosphate reductase activating protein
MSTSSAAVLRLADAHYPVTSLGPARRIGVWMQGCTLACRGCASTDTWDTAGGREISVGSFMSWVERTNGEVDGVTITGGEPFQQAEGLLALLRSLSAWRHGVAREVDLLCYSGYALDVLEAEHPDVLAALDAIIPEPFDIELDPARWRGSSNQPIVPLTPLGQQRYGAGVDDLDVPVPLQVDVGPEGVRLLGIPRRGDLVELRRRAAERGVALGVREVLA